MSKNWNDDLLRIKGHFKYGYMQIYGGDINEMNFDDKSDTISYKDKNA